MTHGPSRLRWQLTLSHLVAIAVTLVSMIGAFVLLVGSWVAVQSGPNREPAQAARIAGRGIEGMVTHGAPAVALNATLHALVEGNLRVQVGPGVFSAEPAARFDSFGPSLRHLDYVVLLAPGGAVLASSDPTGAGFSPPERTDWQRLVAAVHAGERDPASLTILRDGSAPSALGAAPILSDSGALVAIVVIAKDQAPALNPAQRVVRGITILGAASMVVLTASFVFALASASLVAYLLSRRLTSRLERLGRATEALAAGDLSRRVDVGADDEVGQLAGRFNVMAERLSATVAELDAQRRHAEQALAARRELIANVSHELRTPLASIRGHADSLLLLGDAASGFRRRESLAVLTRETERLSRLVDELFLLSTAESGGLPLTVASFQIGDVLDEVAASFRPLARREGQISLVVASEPDLPPVSADRERVIQVLGNLVRNALRYTPEGGLVSLRAERAGTAVRVVIEDTGIGIPPERLARIFDRFYRGDDGRDRESGGAGLGLAIVRELVEAMGGMATADSVPGEGSRFSFTLPTAGAASTPKSAASRHPLAPA
ncbi:MAG: HAMP domain-containing protein [Chloroflexi bacterium]|nr:HAMP domain-containing protein [Chloroflexota bacterium]